VGGVGGGALHRVEPSERVVASVVVGVAAHRVIPHEAAAAAAAALVGVAAEIINLPNGSLLLLSPSSALLPKESNLEKLSRCPPNELLSFAPNAFGENEWENIKKDFSRLVLLGKWPI